MLYSNSWQTFHLDSDFVRALELYDKNLFVWQGDGSEEWGERFYISYDKHGNTDRTTARKNIAMRIYAEDGGIRRPNEKDIRDLMQRDTKFIGVKEQIANLNKVQFEKKKDTERQMRDMVRTRMQDVVMQAQKRPSLFD